MTNEGYLKSALLGGMQITSLLSRPPRSVLQPVDDQPKSLSIPELDRLQKLATASEERQPLTQDKTMQQELTAPAMNRALGRAAQDAQWHSLRTDILLRLEAAYSFRDRASVRSFLESNSFLAPLLLQASRKIREYFGFATRTVLDVSVDPDNGKYKELWARIQTNLTPSDALSLLTKLDEEWWIEASVSSQNLMNINLEFV